MEKIIDYSLSDVASKIYVYSFPEIISKRQLTMKIYPDSYRDIKEAIMRSKLIDRNFIEYKEIKNENNKIIRTEIFSNIDPLVDIIDKEIKRPNLSTFDKYVIYNILSNKYRYDYYH